MEDELCKLEEQLKCPLCKFTLYDPAILVCGHLFCYDCICYGIEFGVRDVVVGGGGEADSIPPSSSSRGDGVVDGKASSSSSKKGNKTTATTDIASPSPGKKRPRAKTFMCPICEQPAYKWTVNKVPQLHNFLEVLRDTKSSTSSGAKSE